MFLLHPIDQNLVTWLHRTPNKARKLSLCFWLSRAQINYGHSNAAKLVLSEPTDACDLPTVTQHVSVESELDRSQFSQDSCYLLFGILFIPAPYLTHSTAYISLLWADASLVTYQVFLNCYFPMHVCDSLIMYVILCVGLLTTPNTTWQNILKTQQIKDWGLGWSLGHLRNCRESKEADKSCLPLVEEFIHKISKRSCIWQRLR